MTKMKCNETYLEPSENELQLMCTNEGLKKRLKEMEEEFAMMDEESYQLTQSLTKERDELKEKLEAFKAKMSMNEFCSPFPSPVTSPTCFSPQPTIESAPASSAFEKSMTSQPSSPMDSLCLDVSSTSTEEYLSLQDNFRSLSEEKTELEVKLRDMHIEIGKLAEELESLLMKNSVQLEMINKLTTENDELQKDNHDVHKAASQMQRKLAAVEYVNVNATVSLFEELEEVKKKEEFEMDELSDSGSDGLPSERSESGFGDCGGAEEERFHLEALYSSYAVMQNNSMNAIEEMKQQHSEEIKSLEEDLDAFKSERIQLITVIERQSSEVSKLKMQKKTPMLSSISNFLSTVYLLIFMFLILYVTFCVCFNLPVFFFVSPECFNRKRITNGLVPM